MNSAIAYYSVTGHSKKIANAVGEALQIPVYDLKKNPDIADCDLLFLVSGIYRAAADPKMLTLLKRMDNTKVRKAALLTSSAARSPGSARHANCFKRLASRFSSKSTPALAHS